MNEWIKLLVKYKGKCATCSKEISTGEYALWSRSSKAIKHIECKSPTTTTTTPEKRDEDTKRPRSAAVAEVDCFICGRPVAYTNCGFEAEDYDMQKAISQACICNRCLEDKNAYQNYQQAFLEKVHKVAKVKI
jgi:hypothetical protein